MLAAAFTVTARVEGSHGYIAGASAGQTLRATGIARGASFTVNYAADNGYRVVSVTDNGREATGFTQTSYRLENITESHDVVVRVQAAASAPAPAPSDPATRVLRRLQSLAQTGDLNFPGMVALIGLACAAAGTAVLAQSRREE